MTLFYDIFFIFAFLFHFPILIIQGKWHSEFKTRLGYFSSATIRKFHGKKCLWIHAVSVGEVLAISGLIEKLKNKFPDHTIVCSTVTKTGYQVANEQLGMNCVVIYAPLDFSWVVRKYISVIDPKIYISTETEIWPNLYTQLDKRNIPVIQINGRISDRAFKGYKRIKFLTKQVLGCVDLFFMQSSLDAERIQLLGAAQDRITIVGNLKFDISSETAIIRKEDLGFNDTQDVLIAGSTHPGEEDILLDVYQELIREFSKLRLVIAPRHVERSEEIVRLIEEKGYKALRFSQVNSGKVDNKTIIVLDVIGQLRKMYGFAKIVFIGKTLTVGGGQNMIEPASFGKPVIVGPLTQNFQNIVRIFLNEEALVQVDHAQELLLEARNLLADPGRAERIGTAAKQAVLKYQGATEKTVQAITALLN